MYNIHTEIPSGAISRGYEVSEKEKADLFFGSMVRQITSMTGMVADVVMVEDGQEIQRRRIGDAS
jgi:hypothetical protein